MMNRIGRVTVVLVALLASGCRPAASRDIILATTTSLRDTGLLDSLLPDFEAQTGYRVKTVAVGSGQALELGRRGDADLVLAHAPAAERALTDSGYYTARRLLAHNDFIIVGPAEDPARIAGGRDAPAALRRVAARGATFVSRGDRSGTHLKELALWQAAQGTPPEGPWYVEAGVGMAATLQLADEKRAYTLSDRATFLTWRDRVALVLLVEDDSSLMNPYHVLQVNPHNAPRVNDAGARALADWLLSAPVQGRIGAFGTARFGRQLFVPDAGKPDPWR